MALQRETYIRLLAVNRGKLVAGFSRKFDLIEREFLLDMLALANALEPSVASWYSVAAKWSGLQQRQPDGSHAPYVDRLSASEEPAALADVHDYLTSALEAAHRAPRTAWRSSERSARTADLVRMVPYVSQATVDARGRLTVKTRPAPHGWEAIVGLAAALVTDPSRRWGASLRRCEQCGNWFLSMPTARGGRPRRFCSDECSATAELNRKR
jgi:hypothetical protein